MRSLLTLFAWWCAPFVVFAGGNALAEWREGRAMPVSQVVAIAASGTVATRQSPSLTSSLGPDGRVSTIAGER